MNTKANFLAALCAAFAITATTEADQIEAINEYLGAAVPAGVSPSDHTKSLKKAFKDAGFQVAAGLTVEEHFAATLASFVTNSFDLDGDTLTIRGVEIKVAKANAAKPANRKSLTVKILTARVLKDRVVANNGKEVLMEVLDLNTNEVLLANTNTNYLTSLKESVFKGILFDNDGTPKLPEGGLVCTAIFLIHEKGVTTYRNEDAAIIAAVKADLGNDYIHVRRNRTASGNGMKESVQLYHETDAVRFDGLSAAIDSQGVKLIEEKRSTKAELAGQMAYAVGMANLSVKDDSMERIEKLAEKLMAKDSELKYSQAMKDAAEILKN